jgi:uncharacterized membrane protein
MHKLNVLIPFVMFLLAVQTAQAISMGTVVKKDLINIRNDESAKFTILLWNVEDVSYDVELQVKEAPKDWLVIIQPDKFALNSSVGEEYIKLPYTDENVKAFPVNVYVKPSNPNPGRYDILVEARAGSPKAGVSFFQERMFKLTVNVTGLQSESETGNVESNSTENFQPLADKLNNQNSNYVLFVLIFVGILVVSWSIYKYA